MSKQLTFPLHLEPSLARADFIVSAVNEQAVRMVDAYPDWPAPALALFGPSGSGKTHLANIWAARAGADIVESKGLDDLALTRLGDRAVALENVDSASAPARDSAIFALLNSGRPMLLTGREPPKAWPVLMPDLASRFAALLSFPLWASDDRLLAELARKLFADRQLPVPDNVVAKMVASLERSPAAIRAFVAAVDARALRDQKPVNLGLIRDLLADPGATTQ